MNGPESNEGPMLRRWSENHAERQTILNFLEWAMAEHRVELAQWEDGADWPLPYPGGAQKLLDLYHEIDQQQLDRERRGLLDAFRSKVVTAGLALLFALAAGQAQAGRVESYSIHCGLKAADLGTTEVVLARGGYERNDLMKDRGVRIGAGVGTCIVAAEVDHKLRKHTKSKWVFRVLAGGLLVFAVQHNARAGR